MNSFERRLKSLPTAKPSDGLRDRIFGRSIGPATLRVVRGPRIALGWAAAVALGTGLAGFVLGNLSDRALPAGRSLQSNIEVRIVEAASDRHNFDLTTSPTDFLTGDVRVEIETQQEI